MYDDGREFSSQCIYLVTCTCIGSFNGSPFLNRRKVSGIDIKKYFVFFIALRTLDSVLGGASPLTTPLASRSGHLSTLETSIRSPNVSTCTYALLCWGDIRIYLFI